MPTACRAHPRPWRRDSVFVPPRVRRLSAPALRAWCGFVHACRRTRVPAADGQRHVAALTGDRLGVAMQLLQLVGWRGQQRVALAALAGAASTSIDTVGRALEFLEGVGLIRRHHMIRRSAGGPVEQDVTLFELREPPEVDPQSAADRVSSDLIVSFLAGRRARHMAAAVQRTMRKALGTDIGPSSGDDEWARWNVRRQLAAWPPLRERLTIKTLTVSNRSGTVALSRWRLAMTRTQADARYIAEQALRARAAGDATAAKYLLVQAEAIDPIMAAAVMTRFETSDCAVGDMINQIS